jgi:hypothetical protein
MFALVCPLAYGQDESAASGGWKFIVTPYFWVAGMDGDTTVRGVESSMDLSFSDILENLDFGVMAHLEASKGKWGLFLDPTYAKLSADGDAGPFDADVEIEMTLVEFGVLYRLLEQPVGSEDTRALSLDLLGGARYTDLEGELDIEGPFGSDPSVDGSKDWLDPIIGGRIQMDLTEKLAFRVRGDIGGFGIGDSSDFVWNVLAGLGYNLSERTTIWAGYRTFLMSITTTAAARICSNMMFL